MIITDDPYRCQSSIFLEATAATYKLRDSFYPNIESVLKTPEGDRKFNRIVEDYINRNSNILTAIGPLYQLTFSYEDKEKIFKLFNLSEDETVKTIKKVIMEINDKANWVFIKQNPIYIILFFVIRYYTIHKNAKSLNAALALTALAYYPSIWFKYYHISTSSGSFGAPPDPGVMKYTIDNLSQRFIIKKAGSIFNMLATSIQNSWKFHEKNIIDGSDANVISFIQRIRNDQNSLMKKIKNEYMKNKASNLRVNTSVDEYDDSIVVDNENDTNRVESMVDKIVLQILIRGIDLRLCDLAANSANVSKLDLRNYITKIIIEKNSDDMKSFLESILFIYLYDEKKTYRDINSKQFISFALMLFKKANSKDKNIINIKSKLDKWGTDSGIYGKFSRVATRIDYTKAIFLYFVFCIQKYS